MPNHSRIFSAVLLVFLIAGCGHGSKADPETDSFQQALTYAKCMRSNGVPDFADPQRKDGGVEVSVGKDQNTPAMTKALEACRDQMPQGDADDPGGSKLDAAKIADWTTCMRAKLPNFPDPEVSGNSLTVTGIKGDSPEFDKARKDCEPRFPGGSLHVVDQP